MADGEQAVAKSFALLYYFFSVEVMQALDYWRNAVSMGK
jgi:hypothetical protein